MSLSQIEIYPPDWHGVRELDFIPRHFTLVAGAHSPSKEIRQWIHRHTRGRYAFGSSLIRLDKKIIVQASLAFESSQEAMLFTLSYQEPEDTILF